jgi:hypothetical protein
MLSWVGNDQLMKMRETSRAVDKKLQVNNTLNDREDVNHETCSMGVLILPM